MSRPITQLQQKCLDSLSSSEFEPPSTVASRVGIRVSIAGQVLSTLAKRGLVEMQWVVREYKGRPTERMRLYKKKVG